MKNLFISISTLLLGAILLQGCVTRSSYSKRLAKSHHQSTRNVKSVAIFLYKNAKTDLEKQQAMKLCMEAGITEKEASEIAKEDASLFSGLDSVVQGIIQAIISAVLQQFGLGGLMGGGGGAMGIAGIFYALKKKGQLKKEEKRSEMYAGMEPKEAKERRESDKNVS